MSASKFINFGGAVGKTCSLIPYTSNTFPTGKSLHHSQMKVPKVNDFLSWRKRKVRVSSEDSHAAESCSTSKEHEVPDKVVSALTANQLAAKAMQLRMKGKHEEAEKLMREAETLEVNQVAGEGPQGTRVNGRKGKRVSYSMSGRADDEYDNDEGPRKKSRKEGGEVKKNSQCMLTQKERCQICFEKPNMPKHLVVAIANLAYLSLPQYGQVSQGHCCILTMQHESATRSVDDDVWNEIRNFKKCLLMMFAKQEKDVLFLETVIGITQQRRHCLVECIPLPREIAKQAPVYFKKAIDEAEEEWSQHNAKKLIDTSQKGLRGSIPKNFPYFYVEFGLDKGYVHVIDNENDFESSFGLDVVRGMLELPSEAMHRRRKHESVDKRKQSVASFARDWEAYDWTKQL